MGGPFLCPQVLLGVVYRRAAGGKGRGGVRLRGSRCPERGLRPDLDRVEAIKKELFRPLEVYEKAQPLVTRGEVNPQMINPKQALLQLQKIMDEYVAGQGSGYLTNGPTLERGLELLAVLKEYLPSVGAKARHTRGTFSSAKRRAGPATTTGVISRSSTRRTGSASRPRAMTPTRTSGPCRRNRMSR